MANTTADKLSYLMATKEAIRQAIIAKGVDVPQNASFRSYATLISTITTGVDTSDATATANDIALGKTAYVQGEKVEGTFDIMESEIPEIGGSLSDVETLTNEIIGDIVEEIVGE